MGSLDGRRGIVDAEERCGNLVGEDEEDVGLFLLRITGRRGSGCW